MRILILGGNGMLGHQLFSYFLEKHETRVTLHNSYTDYINFKIFSKKNTYYNIDLQKSEKILEVLTDFMPDVVINAVGIIKQHHDKINNIDLNLAINALLPHQLNRLCQKVNARFIHFSTDCVFNGKKLTGSYLESDMSDAEDIYGRTKYLGEVHAINALTIRTSLIGFELRNKLSLLEWVLAQKDTIRGFANATYSGFTTNEMARIVGKIIDFPNAYGLYQVASNPISKYELLTLINNEFNLNLEIIPDTEFFCNRSLSGERFNRDFSYHPPTWTTMIRELATIYQAKQNNFAKVV